MMSKPKYSIITVNTNGIKETVQCVNSIFQFTQDFELIIVDNASDDGSVAYLDGISRAHANVKVIFGNKRLTFAENNNLGLKIVHPDAEFIVFLNNDTIVTKDWLERMGKHFENIPWGNIGAIGPISNMSNGRQMQKPDGSPEEHYQKNKGKWSHTGILYGWCMMYRKHVIDEIGGFDERFENSYEDNDLCLRTQLAGYQLAIAYDTFIYHVGQATLKKSLDEKQYLDKGYENRERYYDKWYNPGVKKLVAVYRTNGGVHLEKSLEQTSKFAHSIIIHFCRARNNMPAERLSKLMNDFPKIIHVEFYDGAFQEDYERDYLLQRALELHQAGEADWCISIDDDEIYEDKFISKVQKMMTPRNPEVFGHWCQWRTIWKEELGKEYYRTDSTFGQFTNYRFFRLIKNQKIQSFHHPEGHHCGSAPVFAPENLRWSNIRVKHLGYDTPEQRQRKFDFYQANDHFKNRADIGNDDYSHLISKNCQFEEYDPNLGISLVMMIKNEEEYILQCLENIEDLVDEMIIVDTGSTDKTKAILEKYSKTAPCAIKVVDFPWCDNYSIPRNYGKRLATNKWILCLDADERFQPEDLKGLFHLAECADLDFVIFHVINWLEKNIGQPQPKYASSENVRLYRNYPELFYTGIVHETLDDALVYLASRKKLNGVKGQMLLHHYGYLKTERKVRHKMDYYEDLNLKQIDITDGTDPRPYFNLAMHWLNDGKDANALEAFHQSLRIAPRFWHSSQQMAALNMKNAKHFLKQTIETIPESHPFRSQAVKILNFLNENTFGSTKVV